MKINLVYGLLLLSILSVSLNSCRTDEILTDTEQTQKEKIAFFERFEKDKSFSKDASSNNYALPFGNSMLAYFSNYPDKKTELENRYGTVDLTVSSQDIGGNEGDNRKLLFFPMLKDGKVTAVIAGVINAERNYLYFDVHQNTNSDVYYLINKFQDYYNTKTVSRNSNNPIDVGEVIIIVTRPVKLTMYDGWGGNGGPGNGGHDMGGGPGDYGGGSGSNPNNPNTNDPCAKAKEGNNTADKISETSEFKEKRDSVKIGIANAGPEKGYVFGKDANGNFKSGDIKTGTNSNINLPSIDPNYTITGSVHTHAGDDNFDSFSPLDFYGLGEHNQINPSYNMMFVFGATGSEYSLVITDPIKLKNFISANGQISNIGTDNGWVKGTSIGDHFLDALKQFINNGKGLDAAYALANAYVLTKFDIGMAISKKESDGKFKTLFIKEKCDSNNITNYEETSDCNL
ncbi:hypothetical protein [Chryseobacterium sp.]|uniref:hypothetical protein n=1 Tax=Chryseobacterium sp. TaxID=1871047 RepID=UPI0024E27630|nr:hypothetical protein [Chryseobacterium sp.]